MSFLSRHINCKTNKAQSQTPPSAGHAATQPGQEAWAAPGAPQPSALAPGQSRTRAGRSSCLSSPRSHLHQDGTFLSNNRDPNGSGITQESDPRLTSPPPSEALKGPGLGGPPPLSGGPGSPSGGQRQAGVSCGAGPVHCPPGRWPASPGVLQAKGVR